MLLAIARVLALFAFVADEPRPLYSDDFRHGLGGWTVELEKPGRVEAKDGSLEIDVPAGCTVWFRKELGGPVRIQYEATMISRGGANDRVSDLNCFWMAGNVRKRSGRFEEYNDLRAYYVGQGGNANTTTRFRKYVGDKGQRPLLAESPVMLEANAVNRVQVIANGRDIEYWDNGKAIFRYEDASPYTRGRFGIRTTFNHMVVRNFRVYRM